MNSPEDDEVEKVDSISLDSLPIEVNIKKYQLYLCYYINRH